MQVVSQAGQEKSAELALFRPDLAQPVTAQQMDEEALGEILRIVW